MQLASFGALMVAVISRADDVQVEFDLDEATARQLVAEFLTTETAAEFIVAGIRDIYRRRYGNETSIGG